MEDKHLNIQPPEHSSNLPTVAGRIPLSGCAENMEDSNERRVKAAVEIQRFYRAHRERRQLNGVSLTPDERWSETLAEARRRKLAQSVSPEQQLGDAGKSNGSIGPDGRPRPLGSKGFWKKAIDVAKQAQHNDDDDTSELSSCDDEEEKGGMRKEEIRRKKLLKRQQRAEYAETIGIQYFLEMVDLKHRHGSNLRAYHDYWKQQETKENFFHWLDYGEGKNLDLDICPRERLDREMVRYLSREERQAYLVKIDREGRLCWAKNGERIDTTEEYTDSKQGIVPLGDPSSYSEEARRNNHTSCSSPNSSSKSPSSSSPDSEDRVRADGYRNTGSSPSGHFKRSFHISPAKILKRLLRKSVEKNTWIFVADISLRLYVGIKQYGAFQHSSFLRGGRVCAAGLIKIEDGRLKSLSPLSGHYRPSAPHFRKFIRSLQEAGVDMSGVTVSKSYALLLGLEAYGDFKKGKKKAKSVAKDAFHKTTPERINRRRNSDSTTVGKDKQGVDKGDRPGTSDGIVDENTRKKEKTVEDSEPAVKMVQDLSIKPREPKAGG